MLKKKIEEIAKDIGLNNISILPRDVSPRQYVRGNIRQKKVILMLYPNANRSNKKDLKNFMIIGEKLSYYGVRVPQIYEFDEDKCYAIIEDLGNRSFGDCIRKYIIDKEEVYSLATSILIQMRNIDALKDLHLPTYKNSRIYENRRQIIDYYMHLKRGSKPNEDTVQEFLSVWNEIESNLPSCPQGFLHGDYHLENLIYQGQTQETERCAVIDYQDALLGPLPYDLVNLLEDARVDVPEEIYKAMIDRYCWNMKKQEKENFLIWFRVLAAQFHGRVLGLFIKLAVEQNRDSYLIHIPRLQKYMTKSLEYPVLEPLKNWFIKEGLDFKSFKDLDGDNLRKIF